MNEGACDKSLYAFWNPEADPKLVNFKNSLNKSFCFSFVYSTAQQKTLYYRRKVYLTSILRDYSILQDRSGYCNYNCTMPFTILWENEKYTNIKIQSLNTFSLMNFWDQMETLFFYCFCEQVFMRGQKAEGTVTFWNTFHIWK